MNIRVNWHQGHAASDGNVRVHQVMQPQPAACGFAQMSGELENFEDIASAESAIRSRGYTAYKRWKHCWDDTVVNLAV